MSSRIQEKEKRKAERLAAQRKAELAAARRRRMQMGGGALVAVAIVAALAIALLGGGKSSSLGADSSVSADIKGIKLPSPQIKDLRPAAAAAGCTLRTYPPEGRAHVTTPVNYRTNPPTSGNHNPTPAADGVYDPTNTPAKENSVHALEHGRIEYQYRPGTPVAQVRELEALWNETLLGLPGYKTLLFQNNTKMPFAVAASAWGQLLGCPTFNPKIFDAMRDFRLAYVDKGPEAIPPT